MLQMNYDDGCRKYWMSRDDGSLPGRQVILLGIKHGPCWTGLSWNAEWSPDDGVLLSDGAQGQGDSIVFEVVDVFCKSSGRRV
jgi:hypothetical protein